MQPSEHATTDAIRLWMMQNPIPSLDNPDPSTPVIQVDNRVPGGPAETSYAAWEDVRYRLERITAVGAGLRWHTVPTLKQAVEQGERKWIVHCCLA